MVKILLIRHGYSVSNKAGCFTGRLDAPLDEIGERQAVILSNFLSKNYSIDVIYSSPLSRVVETARPLAQSLNLQINIEPLFIETDIGRWHGKRISELTISEPLLVDKMKRSPYHFKFPDGECENDVYERAVSALQKILSENDGKTVVIATHGGVIRSLLRKFLNIPPERTDLIPLVNNASLSIIDYENGIYTPREIGFDEYLKELSTSYDFK